MERKSFLVTGASSGIGHELALELDRWGHRVFAGVRTQKAADNFLKGTKGNIVPLILDVTKPEDIQKAVDTIRSKLQGDFLHGVVNNAGIVVSGPLEFLKLDDFKKQFDVNVFGPLAVTQAFMGFLRQSQGRLVNVGSAGGRMVAPFVGPYCASKFALRAMNDALRLELRPWKIKVILVEPGPINTPIWEKSISSAHNQEEKWTRESQDLYGEALRNMESAVKKTAAGAVSVKAPVRALFHALTSPRPRSNYVVGVAAEAQALMAKFLPQSIRDGLIAKAIGLP